MSTPLQRAEELKSLISQYQAELSDIYNSSHVSSDSSGSTQKITSATFDQSRYYNYDHAIMWRAYVNYHQFHQGQNNSGSSNIMFGLGRNRDPDSWTAYKGETYFGSDRRSLWFPVFYV